MVAIPNSLFSKHTRTFQHLGAADTGVHETRTFSPKQLSEDGHVHLMELLLFLCDEVCAYARYNVFLLSLILPQNRVHV